MTDSSHDRILAELMEAVTRCLTPDVARHIAALRASPQVQGTLDRLAEKSTGGMLTSIERDKYETYVRAINFIGVLQANARAIVAQTSR